MALLTQKNVGGNTVSSSSASLAEERITKTAAYTTDSLATIGLPHIVFYIAEDGVIPAGSSFTVKFQAAVRTSNGQPLFENIIAVAAPTGGVPLIYSFEYPCIAVRAFIDLPGGFLTNTFSYTLSAYGP
jgi:hypothetical protein